MICPPLAPALVVSLFFSSLLLLQDMPPASAQQQAPVYPPVPLLPPVSDPRRGKLIYTTGQTAQVTPRLTHCLLAYACLMPHSQPYGAPRTGTLLVIDGQVVINTTRPLPPFTVYTSGTGRKNVRVD